LIVVSVKSFGDFVIAFRAVLEAQGGPPERRSALLTGSHLRELALALDAPRRTELQFIDTGEGSQVPALFDMRRRGALAGLASAARLRAACAPYAVRGPFLFDLLGSRERFIAGGAAALALPAAPNIYAAYRLAFGQRARGLTPGPERARSGPGQVLIVPGSRLPSKVIPPEVIASICRQLEANGCEPLVVRLEGETFESPAGVAERLLERSFKALTKAVSGASLVVSADSLAAHLAELQSVGVFVVSPRPNPYWLPPEAFAGGGHAVFESIGSLSAWVARRLCN